MGILDSLSNALWLPGGVRFRIQERSLRPRLAAELKEAYKLLETADKHECATKYSSKQLGQSAAGVRIRIEELQNASTWQSLAKAKDGTSAFESRSKSLRSSLEKLQKVLDLDHDHEIELRKLGDDRDTWEREAAPLLTGKADTEFRRYGRQFRQALADFESCKKLEAIISRLKDMRKAVAFLERIVTQARRLKEDVPKAAKAFEGLDRRTMATDPRSDEIYRQTSGYLEILKTASPSREVDRNIVFLDRIEQNIQSLIQHSNHVRHDAAVEVELWRRVAVICPRAASSFVDRLSKIPLEPSGDSFEEWVSLRRSIENAVVGLARETRSENAAVLNNPALKYPWFDRSETALHRFVSRSYRDWSSLIP